MLNSEWTGWEMEQGKCACGDGGITKLPMVKKNQLASWLLLADVWVFTTESRCLKHSSDLYSKLTTTSFLSQSATTLTLHYSPVVHASFFEWYLFFFFHIQIAPCAPWAPLCLQVQVLPGVSSVPIIAGSFSLSLNRHRCHVWLSTSSQRLIKTTRQSDQRFGTSALSVHPSTDALTPPLISQQGMNVHLFSSLLVIKAVFFFCFPSHSHQCFRGSTIITRNHVTAFKFFLEDATCYTT